MPVSVTMPRLGESVTEGTVTRWLKQVGERVEVDEPLLEVSTDKVDTEIPSPVAGILQQILVAEDETAEVGSELAIIAGDGDAAVTAPASQVAASGAASAGLTTAPSGQPSGAGPAGRQAAGAGAPAGAGQAGPQAAGQAGARASGPDQTVLPVAQASGAGRATSAQPVSANGGKASMADVGTPVTMPALGESVTEGTVTRWLKAVGESVELDEPLLEVSTDKVDTEIPSPVAGTLLEITVPEDETAAVGAQLALIGAVASALTATPAAMLPAQTSPVQTSPVQTSPVQTSPAQTSPAQTSPAQTSPAQAAPALGAPNNALATSSSSATAAQAAAQATVTNSSGLGAQAGWSATAPAILGGTAAQGTAVQHSTGQGAGVQGSGVQGSGAQGVGVQGAGDADGYVTPLVRKLAGEHGVDLATLTGTGVGGRIRKQDVIDAAAKAKAASTPAPGVAQATAKPAAEKAAPSPLRGQTVKLPRLRMTIAKRMVESLHVSAQLTTVVEVDVTRIAKLRDQAKAAFLATHGVKLSYLPFFALATVEALRTHPNLNASMDMEAGTVTYHDAEHLGMAVDTERGLIVPVIRNAGDLNLAGLAKRIADVAARTRSGKITPDELSGGTMTLTNTGSRGALFDTPIINQPQMAIIGTGAVVKRAVVVDDAELGELIVPRYMVYLALSYDHRLVDGADAARFLTAVKERLETGNFEADLGL